MYIPVLPGFLWARYPEFYCSELTALSQMNPRQDKVCKVILSLNKHVACLFKSTDEYQTVCKSGKECVGKVFGVHYRPTKSLCLSYPEFPRILPAVYMYWYNFRKLHVLITHSSKIKCEPPCLCCVSDMAYIGLCGLWVNVLEVTQRKHPLQPMEIETARS